PERRITDEDVYSDSSAAWSPDGKRLVYLAGGDVSNIGQAGRSTAQLYAVALTPEEKDDADRNIDSEEQAAKAERERPRPPRRPADGGGEPGDAEGPPAADKKAEVKIDFPRIGRRARQLTRTADAIGSVAVAPDSKTVVFTTSGTEGGRSVQSVWSV